MPIRPSQPPASAALIAALRGQLARAEDRHDARPVVSTGSLALDRLLPCNGLKRGTLSEYLGAEAASGAGTLALMAAREACREGRSMVILDRQKRFFPLSAAACGIDLSRTLIFWPASAQEELWALDQALRCPGVGAVWATCGLLGVRDFRRLQLAAECGGTLGLLVRPASIRGQPTWADVQWHIDAEPANGHWRLRVTLVRCRGGTGGRSVILELDEQANAWREASEQHATHSLPLSPTLADPANLRRRSRA
jgi:protein ImuA